MWTLKSTTVPLLRNFLLLLLQYLLCILHTFIHTCIILTTVAADSQDQQKHINDINIEIERSVDVAVN